MYTLDEITLVIHTFESSLISRPQNIPTALEILDKYPQLLSYYPPVNGHIKIWDLFEAALQSKEMRLIEALWKSSYLHACLSGQVPGTSIPLPLRKSMLHLSLELRLLPITNLLLTNKELNEWCLRPKLANVAPTHLFTQMENLIQSINNFQKTLFENPNNAVQILKNSPVIIDFYSNPKKFVVIKQQINPVDMLLVFECGLKTKDATVIDNLWKNQELQSCIASKFIPNDKLIKLFELSIEQQLLPIIDHLLTYNERLYHWCSNNLASFESSMIKGYCSAAGNMLNATPFMNFVYKNSKVYACIKEKLPMNEIWTIFEAALDYRNSNLINLLWANQYLKSCLAGQVAGVHVPIETRKRLFQKASNLKMLHIINLLLCSQDLYQFYMPTQAPDSPVEQVISPEHQALTDIIPGFEYLIIHKPDHAVKMLNEHPYIASFYSNPGQYAVASQTGIWNLFKSALASEDRRLIEVIWKNPELQTCLANQPLKIRKEILQIARYEQWQFIINFLLNLDDMSVFRAELIGVDKPIIPDVTLEPYHPGLTLLNVITRFEYALMNNPETAVAKLAHFPEIKLWYSNPDEFADLREMMPNKIDLWILLEAALRIKSRPLTSMLWKNKTLQAAMGSDDAMFVPLTIRVEIFKLAMQQNRCPIPRFLWKNEDLRNWYKQKPIETKTPNIPLSTLITDFEYFLSCSGSVKIVNKVYKNNPELKKWYHRKSINFGTKDKPDMRKLSISALLTFFEQRLKQKGLSKKHLAIIFKSTELKDWFSGNAVDFGTDQQLLKKISFNAFFEHFNFFLKFKENTIINLILETENQYVLELKKFYMGEFIDLGTETKQLSFPALIQTFKDNVDCGPLREFMYYNKPEIQSYFKGWPVNTGTEVYVPHDNNELLQFFISIVKISGQIAYETWQNNVILQYALQTMDYPSFESLLIEINTHFPKIPEFIRSCKNVDLLQNFLDKQCKIDEMQDFADLIAEQIKNIRLLGIENHTNAFEFLHLLPQKFYFDKTSEISAKLAAQLKKNDLLKQQLGIIEIKKLATYHLIKIKDVDLYNQYLSFLLSLYPTKKQADVCSTIRFFNSSPSKQPLSAEFIINRFKRTLLDIKPLNMDKIITLWMDNPVLAKWFGGEKMDCFGIEDNQIPTEELLSCFESALSDPWACKYILQVMFGSDELREVISNLPFYYFKDDKSDVRNLFHYFNAILNSHCINMIGLIWDNNQILQNSINRLNFEDGKLLLEAVLRVPAVMETYVNFITEYIYNIDDINLLSDALVKLKKDPKVVNSPKKIHSKKNCRTIIKNRIDQLNDLQPESIISKTIPLKRKRSNDLEELSNTRRRIQFNSEQTEYVAVAALDGFFDLNYMAEGGDTPPLMPGEFFVDCDFSF